MKKCGISGRPLDYWFNENIGFWASWRNTINQWTSLKHLIFFFVTVTSMLNLIASQRAAHGLAVGSTALFKTNGIAVARLDKVQRPSQSGEAARLGIFYISHWLNIPNTIGYLTIY